MQSTPELNGFVSAVDEAPSILIGVDGERYTDAAIRYGVEMAARMGVGIVGLHVRDPYLKQFYNEIYAQGRAAYLEHVEQELCRVAERAEQQFWQWVRRGPLSVQFRSLSGDPLTQLQQEEATGRYAMIVLGRAPVRRLDRFRGEKLPARLLASRLETPLMVIPASTDLAENEQVMDIPGEKNVVT